MTYPPKSSYRWDAADYAKHSQGQFKWAMGNIDKLALKEDDSVLDIGSGDGKITAELAKRVPRGRVVGIDQSKEMVALAERLIVLPNLSFRLLDARQLDYSEEFDAVFSNSTIHWVPDQDAVIRGIARALKPGGRVFLSMGGRGTAAISAAAIRKMAASEKWSKYLAGVASPHHFLGPEEWRPWLEAAGLHAIRVELVQKPMRLADFGALEGWHRTTWMAYTNPIPEELRGEFLRELTERVVAECTAEEDGSLLMPMVNLEVEATR
jgi:trans-aconitate 2-methyltransferase